MKKAFLALAIVLALIGYTLYTNGILIKKEEKAEVGSYAPDFALIGMDGNEHRLSEVKKPVLINFWASWCGPCRAETPDLNRLYNKYGEEFEILAVNVTVNDKEENAKKFVHFFDIKFPILFDRTGEVTEMYQVLGFPTNIFVDKSGKIVFIANGLLSPEQLERKVQSLIDS